MATPHVAGTIALMLQYAPHLRAIDVPEILRKTARLDSFTGLLSTPSTTWGFGKLDARTATGLFRQTWVINGIPSTIVVPLQVNGTSISVPGGSWTDFYFAKSSTFNVTFARQIQAAQDTRYEYQTEHLVGTVDPVFSVSYSAQYLLTVNSPFGPTSGTGWYSANSNATVSAPETVPAPGILGYLGDEHVLAYWVTNNGGTVSNTIPMDGPKSVTAVYTQEVPGRTFLEVMIASIVLILAAILFARKKLS
jgi:hypothetical protein